MGGGTFRQLEKRFGISATALRRHKAAHLSPALIAVVKRAAAPEMIGLVDRLRELVKHSRQVLTGALTSGNGSQALGAIRTERELLELIGRATGELKEKPAVAVNVQTSPEWVQLRSAIFEAVPPELRLQVAKKLQGLEPRHDA